MSTFRGHFRQTNKISQKTLFHYNIDDPPHKMKMCIKIKGQKMPLQVLLPIWLTLAKIPQSFPHLPQI